MTEESQKEFFEEFKNEESGLKRIAGRIAQKKKSSHIYLSIENVVFITIVALMALVISFALGVEKGKRHATTVTEEIKPAPRPIPQAAPEPEPKREVPAAPAAAVQEIAKEPTVMYVVQLISYKEKRKAEKEIRALSGKCIEAIIVPSGEWFQVCAGRYESFDEADKSKKEFEKTYRGCFVRKAPK